MRVQAIVAAREAEQTEAVRLAAAAAARAAGTATGAQRGEGEVAASVSEQQPPEASK